MPQTVWIVRHANRLDFVHPEWFLTAEKRYDPPLSEDGMIQARQLGQSLKSEPIRHIFCSPFLRTIQTAHYVAEVLNLPIKLEAGFSEWLNPEWMSEPPETHPREILEVNYPYIDWNYTSRIIPQYPENETIVMQRTRETARKLISEFSENILIVGHVVSVLGTLGELLGEKPDMKVPVCGLVKLGYNEEKWELIL